MTIKLDTKTASEGQSTSRVGTITSQVGIVTNQLEGIVTNQLDAGFSTGTVTNQQGDIELHAVAELPSNARLIGNGGGTLESVKVLQFGEHSGHAHRFYEDAPVTLYSTGVIPEDINPHTFRITDLDGEKFAKVGGKGAMLVHEEHRPQYVAPGLYRLNVVSEMDLFSKLKRKVID